MAKLTTNGKTTFGKRKCGKAKKSYNKHSPKPKPYKGQGRWEIHSAKEPTNANADQYKKITFGKLNLINISLNVANAINQ